jgi:UV excision repair protein RAD23
MKINLKTLDRKVFTVEVGEEDKVGDLVDRLEDLMGSNNMYRLIHMGKIMKEEELLVDYNVSVRSPVIVMTTKVPPSTSSSSSSISTGMVLPCSQFKRIRTDSEDSGFDEDENDIQEHFVTDKEFSIALEVISSCEYLGRKNDKIITKKEIENVLKENFASENAEDKKVKEIFMEKLEEITKAGLNEKQFEELVSDIRSIFDESRETSEMKSDAAGDFMETEDELSEDEEEDVLASKIQRLTDMGFTSPVATQALKDNYGNLDLAISDLIPDSSPPTSPSSSSNPLSFLREDDQFQFLRFQVLRNPSLLQPLLINLGQTHPQVMKLISSHKEAFISLLHEQTGASSKPCH